MNSAALWNLLIGFAGLAAFSAIGIMKYRQARYVSSPIAIAWIVFWSIQAARQLGISSPNLLLMVAAGASIVGALLAVIIPYWVEDRHKARQRGH